MIVRLILALTLVACQVFAAKASAPVVGQLVKYDLKPENSLVLPTDFAGHFIIDQTELSKLQTRKIYHIELVYTTYKSSPSFDQDALNDRRVAALKKILPQAVTDKPTWSFVAQTGATTAPEAKTYFHGFVIHYSDVLEYQQLRSFFEEFQKPFQEYQVDNNTGGTFLYASGSSIKLEPNAVTHANGSAVKGAYELTYREFRNPAEIALSGIPMTYTENNQQYNFSSVGMYEIRATQNGEELKLQKPVVVDFNCTAVKEDVSFYSMNQKGKWAEIKEIEFGNQPAVAEKKVTVEDIQNVVVENQVVLGNVENLERRIVTRHYKDYSLTELTKPLWDNYVLVKSKKPELFNDLVLEEIPKKMQVKIVPETAEQFSNIVMFPHMYVGGLPMQQNDQFVGGPGNGRPIPNDKNATLLGAGSTDAGHTYPSLVRGLNSTGFGVYNCDQIYRIGKPVSLAPVYVDAATGKEVTNKHVACVIDLNYNGSFSFHPNMLMCDANGRNVVLLFTSDKKIYMMDETGFAAMDKSTPRVTMTMKDVTAELKTPEDLKKLLHI